MTLDEFRTRMIEENQLLKARVEKLEARIALLESNSPGKSQHNPEKTLEA